VTSVEDAAAVLGKPRLPQVDGIGCEAAPELRAGDGPHAPTFPTRLSASGRQFARISFDPLHCGTLLRDCSWQGLLSPAMRRCYTESRCRSTPEFQVYHGAGGTECGVVCFGV
jgi:hypothetical protein